MWIHWLSPKTLYTHSRDSYHPNFMNGEIETQRGHIAAEIQSGAEIQNQVVWGQPLLLAMKIYCISEG